MLDILVDIDFTLQAGQSLAIVGESGSGKSTLLALLAGLDLPTRGEVIMSGQSLGALDEDGRAALRAREIGFVFQNFQLLGHMTALENVMLPLELAGVPQARARALDMLERVGLGQRLRHYPKLLSGGEQQRVAIIRLILHRPALATLDECTSVISESQQKTFYRYLRSLNMPTFLWGTGLSCSGFMTRLLCLSPVLSVAGLNHLLQVLRLEGRGSARCSLISQQCKI